MTNDKPQTNPMNDVVAGALWCVGGIVATVISYNMAAESEGGRYWVFWGAIIFGGWQFLKGLVRLGNVEDRTAVTEPAVGPIAEPATGAAAELVCWDCGGDKPAGNAPCPKCGSRSWMQRAMWERAEARKRSANGDAA